MTDAPSSSAALDSSTKVVEDAGRGRYRLYLRNRPSTAQVGSITHGGPAQYLCPRCKGRLARACAWCLDQGWVAGGHA